MAYIPRSSFSQAPGVIPMQIKKKHTIRVFNLLGTLLMISSLVATTGVFLYKSYLQKNLSAAQVELNAIGDSNNEKRITEIEVYDHKLSIARSLLNDHIAPSRIFSVLEDATKQTVQFKSFDYLYDPGFEAEVTLIGDTKELKSVALQKMQMLKNGVFSDFVVRNITTQPLVAEENDVADKNQNNQNNKNNNSIKSDLGAGFEVVGLFDISALTYTGETITNVAPTTAFSDSSNTIPVSDVNEISTLTAVSSNDVSI